jgi:hypothetical protein
LRALPFFLLPAVLLINEKQLGSQSRLLLVICLLQLPLAWTQRMAVSSLQDMSRNYALGMDYTYGTLMGSGLLSLFLIAAACVLTGFYLRGKLSLGRYILLFLCFVLPTTLNETKVTLFLLPLALLLTFFFGSARGNRLKNTMLGVVIAAGFLAAFIPIYDHFMQPRWGYGLIDFLQMEGRVEGYLMKGTEIGDQSRAGRLDGLIAAFDEISRDPATLVFGFGIGNASESALGPQYAGAYSPLFEGFPLMSLVYIMLELGLLGLLLLVAIFWQILRDSIFLAHMDTSAFGALAVGWTGVSLTVFCGLMYSSSISSVAISYLYWYFSGVIAARRMQIMSSP